MGYACLKGAATLPGVDSAAASESEACLMISAAPGDNCLTGEVGAGPPPGALLAPAAAAAAAAAKACDEGSRAATSSWGVGPAGRGGCKVPAAPPATAAAAAPGMLGSKACPAGLSDSPRESGRGGVLPAEDCCWAS